MRKTKKEKIKAAERRERFLYSLSAIQQTPSKEETKESPKQEKSVIRPNVPSPVPVESFSYLGKDLRKIALLAATFFAVQIVLYLTIF